MALADAWWMNPSSKPQPQPSQRPHPEEPHRAWPWYQSSGTGLSFKDLESYLKAPNGRQCLVEKYRYVKGASSHGNSLWKHSQTVTTPEDLVKILKVPELDDVKSTFYIVSDMCPEVVQALGHYLKITQRFFNISYMPISMGTHVEHYMHFGIQVMERYGLSDTPPLESRRVNGSPHFHFRTASSHALHKWYITRVALIFVRVRRGDTDTFNGVIQLDAKDSTIARGLKILMTRDEEVVPEDTHQQLGIGHILSEVLYILSYNWGVLMKEAEEHLRVLSKKCVDEDLSSSDQLSYTRELHQLTPLWAEVRQRLNVSRDLSANITSHPFLISIKAQEGIESYIKGRVRIFDDLLERTEDLEKRTNNLISLIFNIATLQDTRAAVEESKAANAFAASIHRITSLTFFYLPLTLAASIYGMNIRQITGDGTQGGAWQYAALSVALMAATFTAWFAWSRLLIKWRARRPKPLLVHGIPLANV